MQDTPSHTASEPAKSRYVEQLEKRIDEKDDVIGLLKSQQIEEYASENTHLKNTQQGNAI